MLHLFLAHLVKSYMTYLCKLKLSNHTTKYSTKYFASNIREENTRHFWAKIFCEILLIHTIALYSHSNVPFCTLCEHFRTFCTLKTFSSIATKKFDQQGHTQNKENLVTLGE